MLLGFPARDTFVSTSPIFKSNPDWLIDSAEDIVVYLRHVSLW
jgi:hypothetical protein